MLLNRSTRFHCHSGRVGVYLASFRRPARVSSVSFVLAHLSLIALCTAQFMEDG